MKEWKKILFEALRQRSIEFMEEIIPPLALMDFIEDEHDLIPVYTGAAQNVLRQPVLANGETLDPVRFPIHPKKSRSDRSADMDGGFISLEGLRVDAVLNKPLDRGNGWYFPILDKSVWTWQSSAANNLEYIVSTGTQLIEEILK